MPENKNILVLVELVDGKVSSGSLECLGAARSLASSLGGEVLALLPGQGVQALSQELISCGADRVYLLEDPLLAQPHSEVLLHAVEQACSQLQPNILLMGQTPIVRDLAPRLAFRLGTGLAMDCTEVSIDPATRLLQQTRPIYGGVAMATYSCPEARPQMATIRAKAVSPLPRDLARKGEVIPMKVSLNPSVIKVQVISTEKQKGEGVRLEDAEVVVSGGRGLGESANFKHLEELAKVLKGAVGASRAACDQGWIDSSHQIGLTGKVVSPSLYIAVGISGASQHMSGCSGAKVIVAINKDPDASIFKEARYGVVGDWKQVLPAFTETCKELLGS